MKFFSGFSLENEAYLLTPYLDQSDYTISGFSYGCIEALNTTMEMIQNSQRVDRLQLLSPAFFQTKEQKFKRLQLMSYKKSKLLYMKQFLRGCFHPYDMKIVETKETDIAELKELLEYEWSLETLEKLKENGVQIEVYLGSRDAIIDVENARKFFLEVATLTYIKEANHFLQVD